MRRSVLVLVLLLAYIGGSQAHAELLKGPQIQANVSGAKIVGKTDTLGSPYTIWFHRGGSMNGILGDKRQFDDRGRWWVKDNKLCMHWELWVFGKVWCYDIDLTGNELTRIDQENTIFIRSTLVR